MPKRKRDDSDSLSYIKRKIKKLERKLAKKRRRRISSSSSDVVQVPLESQDNTVMENDNMIESRPPPTALKTCEITQELPQPTSEVSLEEQDAQTQELDETILEILGVDPSTNAVFGKDIQKDLAIRYQFIATAGLTNEIRKELLESHLPPANCKLIDAPSLNPEVKAAVADGIMKRDKAMQVKQKQIGSAIACLSEAITILLSKETKDPSVLKLLMDTERILCDSQHKDSVTRRNFILAVLKKDLKDQIQLTKIDSLLFGQELAETLKTAKAINKSGAELQSVAPNKNINTNRQKPPAKNLNWKAGAPSRRPQVPQRAKESAPQPRPPTRHPPAHSSRGSRQSTSRGRH